MWVHDWDSVVPSSNVMIRRTVTLPPSVVVALPERIDSTSTTSETPTIDTVIDVLVCETSILTGQGVVFLNFTSGDVQLSVASRPIGYLENHTEWGRWYTSSSPAKKTAL